MDDLHPDTVSTLRTRVYMSGPYRISDALQLMFTAAAVGQHETLPIQLVTIGMICFILKCIYKLKSSPEMVNVINKREKDIPLEVGLTCQITFYM